MVPLRRPLALAATTFLLAGCGGGGGPLAPRLAHDDAKPLIELAGRIAGEGACDQARDIRRLRTRAIALVNARRVPPGLQDTLLSAVNALSAEAPVCLPTVKVSTLPATTVQAPPPPPPGHGPKGHDHGDHHGHDHGDGHGDGGGE
jgi:hypothetical protein